ncbi:aerotaxis receptor [Austwickia chelonae]|uniref:PAS domain-containing protein n=1 Tax=Austwickia chelonae TaxID=100225 RepID=UPI0008CFABAA|nr:PAS domain-containing protein [Austwickia chelonae]SEW36786.1 aerotaxis receptor [Austwickia chelonae]
MPRVEITPTDQEYVVGVDELFFSATDRAGVIELVNSTFARLSHYTHDELVGKPHNVVRHPDMPGGAYKLVWKQLHEGRPACAYVKNIAADGSFYWVFATLLPVGDKFLSVRKRPQMTDLLAITEDLYSGARSRELQAHEEGSSRAEAAEIGCGIIVEELAKYGITNGDDLALNTLPREVLEHVRHSGGLPRRPDATGPLGDLLRIMHEIDTLTVHLVHQMDEYADFVRALESSYGDAELAAARLRDIAAAARRAADLPAVGAAARKAVEAAAKQAAAAGHEVEEGMVVTPFVAELSDRMSGHADKASEELASLVVHLRQAAEQVRWLRMRIALLRLHNLMVGTFASELIDGHGDGDTTESMRLLCQALQEGVVELIKTDDTVREAAGAVPALVEDAVRQADRVLRLVTKWRPEIGALGCADIAQEHLDAVSAITEAGFDELHRFYTVAARCSLLGDNHDEERLAAAISNLANVLDEYSKESAA